MMNMMKNKSKGKTQKAIGKAEGGNARTQARRDREENLKGFLGVPLLPFAFCLLTCSSDGMGGSE